jgi:hypothetical protein
MENDETPRNAVKDEAERVRVIFASMEGDARPGFDEDDIQQLHILIRVTVEFHDYLTSVPPWPQIPDDPFHNMTYMVDKVLFNIDSFHTVVDAYAILVGATRTTIDWDTITAQSLKDRFLSLYQEFVAETNFENKCRLLLDLFKLQIVYAGMFYDSKP